MSIPPFDPDDPRLTAYALGESDETDRQAVEKLLTESAPARAEVEQTQVFARLLAAEYAQEHAEYLASRPVPERPSNIVEFRNDRRDRWRRSVVPALKVAALLTLTASLVYLTLRRPVPATTQTAASLPLPATPLPAATPPLVAVNQAPQNAVDTTREKDGADSVPLLALSKQSSAGPAKSVTATTDTLLATKDDEPTGGAQEQPSLARTSANSSARAFALPPVHLDLAAPAPPATVAANVPVKPPSPDEQIARSVVRIHSSAGAFYGGVAVSSDRLILAGASLPEDALQPPCTVRLADERELPAIVERPPFVSGWYTLHVDAAALSPVTLAREAPSGDALLSIPLVDSQSGALSILHARAIELNAMGGDVHARASKVPPASSIAFNAAGELLMAEYITPQSKTDTRAKTAGAYSGPIRLRARPFTEAERASLRRAIERK